MTVYDVTMCDITTGEIVYIITPNEKDDFANGGVYGGLRAWHDTDSLFVANQIADYYHNGTTFVQKAARPSMWYEYNWSNHTWEFNSTGFWAKVRADRDYMLNETDYIMMADSTFTAEKKAEWATYRQAVRDVPANNSSVTDYDDIVWPTAPS